jgi:hypothetical protein
MQQILVQQHQQEQTGSEQMQQQIAATQGFQILQDKQQLQQTPNAAAHCSISTTEKLYSCKEKAVFQVVHLHLIKELNH